MSLKVKLIDFLIDLVYYKIKKIYFDLFEQREIILIVFLRDWMNNKLIIKYILNFQIWL